MNSAYAMTQWAITDIQSTCLCGESFTIDHPMIGMRGGFVIQRHNELRDLAGSRAPEHAYGL